MAAPASNRGRFFVGRHQLSIYVETHRATAAQDVRRTVDLVSRISEVRFNGDFSHRAGARSRPLHAWQDRNSCYMPGDTRLRAVRFHTEAVTDYFRFAPELLPGHIDFGAQHITPITRESFREQMECRARRGLLATGERSDRDRENMPGGGAEQSA